MKKLLTIALIFWASFQSNAQVIDLVEQIPGPPFQNAVSSGQAGSISGADVDLDGDTDILISGLNAQNFRTTTLYLNDGVGNFAPVAGTPFVGVDFGDTEFGDVDGDGDPDLLVTGRDNAPVLYANIYQNDGNGNFSLLPNPGLTPKQAGDAEFADLDGDGDLDLLMMGYQAPEGSSKFTRMFINNGSGSFTLQPGTPFPAMGSGKIKPFDMDGDGDEDVILSGVDLNGDHLTFLYENDGLGGFTLVPSTSLIDLAFSEIAAGDTDGDGDLDLVISGINTSFSTLNCALYLNDGSGNFSLQPGTPFPGNWLGSIDLADYDADGDLDVHISGKGIGVTDHNSIFRNDGNNVFVEVDVLEPLEFSEAVIADLDGDADLDAVMIGFTWNSVEGFKTRTFLNALCSGSSCQGCTDPLACNFDPDALFDDSSCNFDCIGCTNSVACNFDPSASIDDGSCDYSCLTGCTYPQASNYDPLAFTDDGTCVFDEVYCGPGTTWDAELGICICSNSNSCLEDINVDFVVNTGDLVLLLSAFGQTCP